MKRISLNYLALFVFVSAILSSCGGLQKMADRAEEVNYVVTPKVLEMHAEKVPVKITGNFPAKYFDKNAILVVTPTLKYEGGEKTFRSFTIQGENVMENNELKVSYKTGGTISYEDTIPYIDAMRVSDLELVIAASLKDEKVHFVNKKIADGVITTPRLVEYGMLIDSKNDKGGKTVMATVALDDEVLSQKSAVIYYALQKYNVRRGEMTKAEISELLNLIIENYQDQEKELTNIEIASYASPDGPEDLNSDLVDNRGKSAKGFVEKELNKKKVEKVKEENFISKATTPTEDWEGFRKLVQESNMADKELILRVLTMYQDPVVREREIKNISEAYTGLKDDILPFLRRSILKVNYKTKKKTNEEMAKLAETNPSALNAKELMFAATLTDDLDKKIAIYTAATTQFGTWDTYNNLACVYVSKGDLTSAATALTTAASKNENGMVLNNQGVVAMANGDFDKATEYFAKAKEAGCTNDALGYNMGVINIKEAKYTEAINNFGATASYNKALAQLLSGDAAGAESTMNSLGECKMGAFYYLKAVIAARLDKQADLFTNLKTAVKKDAALKAYAKDDMEFNKFAGAEEFKTIIE